MNTQSIIFFLLGFLACGLMQPIDRKKDQPINPPIHTLEYRPADKPIRFTF